MPSPARPDDQIRFQIHPRVFAALGEDLVTNDIVAVLELVKNAYDAFATRVDVVFGSDTKLGSYLDIKDNGVGMSRKTVQEAWCVVATPYRQSNPLATKGKQTRRVAGAKGLGRLSAARLGKKLWMLTKSATEPCWSVEVDWSLLSERESLESCFVTCRPFEEKLPFEDTGTRVRIFDLNSDWRPDQIADLDDNLTRLISPFSKVDDFTIHLTAPDSDRAETLTTKINAPDFLNRPPYAIRGHVTAKGQVKGNYEFHSVTGNRQRQCHVTMDWPDVRRNSDVERKLTESSPGCGPFEFEIRAWDIGSEDTREVAEHFEIKKGTIRQAIKAHKGISVYRDGVLVLPKLDENRDWLGLDARRISKVGTRLGTSQIVGYVAVTAENNKEIEDTSDREGLARNSAVLAFEEILRAIVGALEKQRDEDRLKPADQVKLRALLDDVSGEELIKQVNAVAEEGGSAQEALVSVRDFSDKLAIVRDALKTRLVYYSRLATVGTIAQMLVHEIRNRTTAIGRFLRSASKGVWKSGEEAELRIQLSVAEDSVQSLEQLADTFAPLASRTFRRGKRDTAIEDSISRCVSMLKGEIEKEKVKIDVPTSNHTRVSVDPGELDTVILNLLNNALYWVGKGGRKPIVEFSIRKIHNAQRVRVSVSDSGPGVAKDDVEKVFLPGVTRKPGGIGMGLTVAAELVSEYGGRLALEQPGRLGGATFNFDIPLKV